MLFSKASVPIPTTEAQRMALIMAKKVVSEPPDPETDLIVIESKDVESEAVRHYVSHPPPLLLVVRSGGRPSGVVSITNGLVNWMEAGELAILIADALNIPLRRIYVGTHYTKWQVDWFREKAGEHGIKAEVLEMRSVNLASLIELTRGYDLLVLGKGRIVLGREALSPLVKKIIKLLRMNTLMVGSVIAPSALVDMLLEPEEMLMHYTRGEAFVKGVVENVDILVTDRRLILHPSPPASEALMSPIIIKKGEVGECVLEEEDWIAFRDGREVKVKSVEEPAEKFLSALRLLFKV